MRSYGIYTAVLALVMTVGLASQANSGLISQSQEMSMGKEAARQIEAQYHVSNDSRMNELVNSIGSRLAKVCTRPGLTWTFKVLDTKEVNAVSVPSFVYVNKGLIDFVNGDKDQLAAVIGHEIGHTCGKHAVKQAEKSMLWGTGISILLKGGGANAANIFANLALLGYSRKDEYQADKFGVDFAYKAGYDPNGAVKFFEHLGQKEKDPSKFNTYFRTHPPTSERIKRVKTEIENLKRNG
jgi:beta-barrel assembly-enhancing protease